MDFTTCRNFINHVLCHPNITKWQLRDLRFYTLNFLIQAIQIFMMRSCFLSIVLKEFNLWHHENPTQISKSITKSTIRVNSPYMIGRTNKSITRNLTYMNT